MADDYELIVPGPEPGRQRTAGNNQPLPQSWGNRPPADAVRFLEAKALKQGFSYLDVWREEHATSFTVAKAMETNILSDIKLALVTALREGKTKKQFVDELGPYLESKGWWGRKDVIDPLTGKTVTAQLGSPERLKLIYDVNLRQARAAGTWERAQRAKDTHGYAQYLIGPSARHRPEHVAWNTKVFHLDDPWWQTHWPPLGYRCRCFVRVISNIEAKKIGVSDSPPIEYVEFTNSRTGEISSVPKGVTPGFDFNPGLESRKQHGARFALAQAGSVDPNLGAHQAAGVMRYFAPEIKKGNDEYIEKLGTLPPSTTRIVGAVPPGVPARVPIKSATVTGKASELQTLETKIGGMGDRLVSLNDPDAVYWDERRQVMIYRKSDRFKRSVVVMYRTEGDLLVQIGMGLENISAEQFEKLQLLWVK